MAMRMRYTQALSLAVNNPNAALLEGDERAAEGDHPIRAAHRVASDVTVADAQAGGALVVVLELVELRGLDRVVVVIVLVPEVHGQARDRAAVAVADDEDFVVVVLAVFFVSLAELLLD